MEAKLAIAEARGVMFGTSDMRGPTQLFRDEVM